MLSLSLSQFNLLVARTTTQSQVIYRGRCDMVVILAFSLFTDCFLYVALGAETFYENMTPC